MPLLFTVGVLAASLVVALATGPDAGKSVYTLAGELADATIRHARRVVIFVVGTTLLLIGVLLLVLPGPGVVVIALGLAVLGAEFAWARRWMARAKATARELGDAVRRRAGRGETTSAERPDGDPVATDETR